MKKYYILLAIISCSNLLFSQNNLCREPGTKFAAVMDHLLAKDHVNLKMVDTDRIIATANNFVITYYFSSERLYQVMLQQRYLDKKSSISTLKGFQEWFRLLGTEVIETIDGGKRQNYVAVKDNRMTELNWQGLDSGGYEITLVTLDISLCPEASQRAVKPTEQAIYANIFAE